VAARYLFGSSWVISKLPQYLYCGLTVVSNLFIPELQATNSDKPEFSFRLEEAQLQSQSRDWLQAWLSQTGEPILSYRPENYHHWLQFRDLAVFQISYDSKEVICYPVPQTSQETVRHLLLDQVLPRCLAHQGRIMLHASAVQYEGRLLLFIGDSGAGKSTLAADFHQAGIPAVSDDCLWLRENHNRIEAIPNYGGLRLWDDSLDALFSNANGTISMAHYSAKKRVSLSENTALQPKGGIPILAAFVLSKRGQVSTSEVMLQKLSSREAFIAMAKQSFHLSPLDLEGMTSHLHALGRIVPRLNSFRLSLPHNYDLLPLVRQRILEAIA
jgi:hypothetical protein